MKNKILLTTIFSVFLLSFVSASIGCGFEGYNMYSPSYTTVYGEPIHLNSQNIVIDECCEEPIVNNYWIKTKPTIVMNYMDNQHIILNDCCESPILNNHMMTYEYVRTPIMLDTFHHVNTCCEF